MNTVPHFIWSNASSLVNAAYDNTSELVSSAYNSTSNMAISTGRVVLAYTPDIIKDNCPSILTSTQHISPEKHLRDTEDQFEREITCCDPMFLVVKIGTIYLEHQKLLQEQKTSEKQPGMFKIGIRKETSNIEVQFNNCMTSIMRCLNNDSRDQLHLLRPHLLKALKWFPLENNADLWNVYQYCWFGLEILLKTYSSQKINTVVLLPKEKNLTSDSNISNAQKQIDIYAKQRVTHPGIANDMNLLNQALQNEDYASTLEEEEKLYFQFYNMNLINSSETVENYMQEAAQKFWTPARLAAISNLFETHAVSAADALNSINTNIQNNPKEYTKIKKKLKKLVNIPLNYSAVPAMLHD